jgi:transcriptional regulator with XRE-family HTH domain
VPITPSVTDQPHLATGIHIAQARREAGLTQSELARGVGISLGLLEKLERGAADPSDYLERVATATGRPVTWLARGEETDDSADLLAELLRAVQETHADLRSRLEGLEDRLDAAGIGLELERSLRRQDERAERLKAELDAAVARIEELERSLLPRLRVEG